MSDSVEAMEAAEVVAGAAGQGGIDPLLALSVVGGLLFCYAAWWVLRHPFEEEPEA